MAIGYLVRRNIPFTKRDPEEEKEYWKLHQGVAVLFSIVNDADIVTDWIYFVVNVKTAAVNIPNWLQWLQLSACITGTLSWLFIASDGRVLDWIRRAAVWPALILVYTFGIFFFILRAITEILHASRGGGRIRGYDITGWYEDAFRVTGVTAYFEEGFQFSRGRLLFVGIFLEDLPQVFVTFMIEDVLKEEGTIFDISGAAQLNLLIAIFDIGHKVAESWDSRHDVGKAGDDSLRTLRGHKEHVLSLLVMGGTKFVSTSHDETIKLWDAATGKVIWTIEDIGFIYNKSIARIDETHFVTASYCHRTCRVYDIESVTKCVKEIEHPLQSVIRCVAVSPDGTYFLISCDDDIVWKWNSAPPYEKLGEYEGVKSTILAFLDNEHFLASGLGHKHSIGIKEIRLYHETSNSALLTRQYCTGGVVKCIAPMSTHAFLVGMNNSNIQLFSSESGLCTMTFSGHTRFISSIAKVDESHFISGSADTTTKLWNIRGGECLRTFKGHTDLVVAVVYVKESGVMISSSWDRNIKVWSLDRILDSDGEDGVHIISV